MSRRSDIRQVSRSDSHAALTKAMEFTATAKSELSASRWNSAGLTAIHAGISAADAALIASAGLRSTSQDHGAVLQLLDDQVPEFTATQRRQLGGMLKMKNHVAYEQRLLAETEARQLVDQADRLTRWAGRVVDDHLNA